MCHYMTSQVFAASVKLCIAITICIVSKQKLQEVDVSVGFIDA